MTTSPALDVLKKVQQRIVALKDLHTRMDADRDLYYLKPYVMKDKDQTEVPSIINVTLNIAATFAAHVQSALMGATQQVKVSGLKFEDEAASKVENFLNALFLAADGLLRQRNEPALRAFLTEQLDIRGRAAARVTCRMENGRFIPDILPLDTRYFAYEMDNDGMEWGAYTTLRSVAMIESEYGNVPGLSDQKGVGYLGSSLGLTPSGLATKDFREVTDYWDRNTNRVYVGESLVREQKNAYRKPPFAVQLVPLGSMLKDNDALTHEGESIFFLIRDLLPELNRFISIAQTLNQGAVSGAKEWQSKEGTQAAVPEHLDEFGAVTAADIGGGSKLVPVGDIKEAGRLVQSILTRMIQAGSLSFTDYGNLTFPLSAVALVQLGEGSNQVFLPRLGAKGLLFQQLAEMVIEQTLDLGISQVELGTKGHTQKFAVSGLKGDYDIEYQYWVKSPETDVALYAIADQARLYLPMDEVLSSVLHLKNPAEIRQKMRYDEAEVLSSKVKLYRTAVALIEQGKELEAKIIADELGLSIEQLATGQLTPKPKSSTNGREPARNTLIPMIAGTQAASNKRASQLMGEPGAGIEP